MSSYEFLDRPLDGESFDAALAEAETVPDAEEARALLRARTQASDELQRRLDDRMPPHAAGDAPMPTETILRYEAVRLPHAAVVIEIPSKRTEAVFRHADPHSFEQAATHADQLNKWLVARPAPDKRYRIFVPPPEPTEAGLVALIDRIYEPEERLAALALDHLAAEALA